MTAKELADWSNEMMRVSERGERAITLAILLTSSLMWPQQQPAKNISPEAQRLLRVVKVLFKSDPHLFLQVCGPEDNIPECNTPNAWAQRETRKITFTKRAMHDLQSDDEVACIFAHESGHVLSRNQLPYTTLENRTFDEQDADDFAVPMVMLANYDSRACPTALQHIGENQAFNDSYGHIALRSIFSFTEKQTREAHGYNIARENRWKRETQFLCTTYNGNGWQQFRNSPACLALNSGEVNH